MVVVGKHFACLLTVVWWDIPTELPTSTKKRLTFYVWVVWAADPHVRSAAMALILSCFDYLSRLVLRCAEAGAVGEIG